jgi:hypothetical protein
MLRVIASRKTITAFSTEMLERANAKANASQSASSCHDHAEQAEE